MICKKDSFNEFKNWKVIVAGNEQREQIDLDHPNAKINNWIPHEKY